MVPEERKSPVVLISGAGLGGLMLGVLLERAGIQYHIFEKSSAHRSLGSVVVLGPSILPVFEQLGMLEDLEKYSLPFNSVTIYNEKPDGKLKHMGGLGMKDEEEISGHRSLTFLRQRLYEALLSRISPENISLGKKLLKVVERDDRIIMYCSDRSAFIGDILVGADGAYSAVRQNAYKAMKREGVLPKTDAEDLLAGYTCMIGITDPVNPEKYPQVKEGHANGETVLGRDSKSWSIYVTEENRIYWSVKIQYKSMDEAKRQMFMTSEWAPGLDHAMVKEFQDRPCPYGGTLGDLFNMTRKETAVKVYLEHKMFETWFYRRSVLIGDACHKMLPSAGQGAVNALQDAVILANCLYELKNIRQPNVTAAFQSYYDQRYQHAKAQYYNSELAAKLTIGLSWSDKIARMVYLNLMPMTTMQNLFYKAACYRPQIAFIPRVPYKGTGTVLPQPQSSRYVKEQQERRNGGDCLEQRCPPVVMDIYYPAEICFLPPGLQ